MFYLFQLFAQYLMGYLSFNCIRFLTSSGSAEDFLALQWPENILVALNLDLFPGRRRAGLLSGGAGQRPGAPLQLHRRGANDGRSHAVSTRRAGPHFLYGVQ